MKNRIDIIEDEYIKYCSCHSAFDNSILCFRNGPNSYLPLLDICIFNNTSGLDSKNKLRSIWLKCANYFSVPEIYKEAAKHPHYLSVIVFFNHEVYHHRAPLISSSISLPITLLNYILNEEFENIILNGFTCKAGLKCFLNHASSTLTNLLFSCRKVLEGFALFTDLALLIYTFNLAGMSQRGAIERGYELMYFATKKAEKYYQKIYIEGLNYCLNIFKNWGMIGAKTAAVFVLNPYIKHLVSFKYDPFARLSELSEISFKKKPKKCFKNALEAQRFMQKYISLEGWTPDLKKNKDLEFLLTVFPLFENYRWRHKKSLVLKNYGFKFLPPQIFTNNANSSNQNWIFKTVHNNTLFLNNFFKTFLREQYLNSILAGQVPSSLECPYKIFLNSCDQCKPITGGIAPKVLRRYSELFGHSLSICKT